MRSIKTFRRLLPLGLLLAAALQLAACSSSADRAQSYYKSGTDYAAKGDLVKASLEFRNALKLKADLVAARLALADVEERQQSFADAARDYAAVTEQDPKNVTARVRLAYILLAAGQLDDASKYAEEAAKLAPEDPSVMVAQASVALKNNKPDDAVRLAQAALAKAPGSADALMVLASERLNKGDAKAALAYLNQGGDGADSNVALQIMRLVALDASGDQPGVEDLFKKLIALYPDNAGFSQALARWYVSNKRLDDAEAVMRDIAQKHPADDAPQLDLVSFVSQQHGAVSAIAELNTIIATREKTGGDAFTLKMALVQLQYTSGDQAGALQQIGALVDSTKDAKEKNQARVQWARMLVAQKDTPQAAKLVDTVIADDAGNVDALALRASLRMLGGDSADAIPDLLAALNQAPDDAATHGLLAEAYDHQGSTALADEQYSKAMDLAQDSPQAGLPYVRFLLRLGKTDQAERTLELVAKRAPDNRDVLTQLAQTRLALKDWTGVLQVADTLRKVDTGKNDPTADQITAAALNGQGKFPQSIELLKAAVTAAPAQGRGAVLTDLVNSYVAAGLQADAETYLQSLLAQSPADLQLQMLLAQVYRSDSKPDLAEQALKTVAAQDSSGNAQLSLAQLYLSQGRLDDAAAAAKLVVDHDAASSGGRLLLASIYEQQQQFDQAIALYDDLYKQDPTSMIVANDLASLLSERRGDKASLDRAHDIAQRLAGSEVPQYLDTLGWIDHLRGDDAAALPSLKAAAAGLPNIAQVQYHLGVALGALGQVDLAKETLNKAMSMTPPLLEADVQKARAALDKLNAPPPPPGQQG